ncbi:galactosyltransferase-related protein [Amycolatopsis sp. PS_44_ISF1]|uniref:glycosyltransferase family 2 protein n=1 Tax=Amycolatopsis sp. PS_44_ISF1 TaxID=2974917 RepID=UPI0028E034CF|nr:galactosyltransferase-related protein [Amycolatopsis sp. PS_44_ISF1]MDT8913012.1 galactosyltransferase-related protein [Amycolatopsis sp. PS_44_ISF1]
MTGPARPPRTAVVTIAAGRDSHLRRQRAALDGADAPVHVVVGMGAPPRLPPRPPAPPVTPVAVPLGHGGLPLAAARNAGARAAIDQGAELLVFLDVDCIPGPGCLARYVAAAGRVPPATLLCGPVAYLPPPPSGGYPEPGGLARLARPHEGRPAPEPGEITLEEQRFELFWSLSFALTREDWARFGGFCEEFVGYGAEDTDFALRAAERGARLAWVGGATAYHQHHPPSRHEPRHVRELVANAHRFRRRHGFWPMADWLAELDRAGAVRFDRARDTLRLLPGSGARLAIRQAL